MVLDLIFHLRKTLTHRIRFACRVWFNSSSPSSMASNSLNSWRNSSNKLNSSNSAVTSIRSECQKKTRRSGTCSDRSKDKEVTSVLQNMAWVKPLLSRYSKISRSKVLMTKHHSSSRSARLTNWSYSIPTESLRCYRRDVRKRESNRKAQAVKESTDNCSQLTNEINTIWHIGIEQD